MSRDWQDLHQFCVLQVKEEGGIIVLRGLQILGTGTGPLTIFADAASPASERLPQVRASDAGLPASAFCAVPERKNKL
jgi:hypothetical protein